MARKAREKSETGFYAVMLKGICDIFRGEDDYDEFISKLGGSAAEVLGGGLTKEYVFLCVRESAAGIASDMRSVIISYARYYNKKYGVSGRLFDGRFKSEPLRGGAEVRICVMSAKSLAASAGGRGIGDGYEPDGGFELTPLFAAAGKKTSAPRKRKPSAAGKRPEDALPKPQSGGKAEPEKQKRNEKKNLPPWLL